MDAFLFKKIETACIEEVKKILGAAGDKFKFNRFDSDRGGGSVNVKSGSFDLKIDMPSVNVSVLAGKLTKIGVSREYILSLDIYFSVVECNDSEESERRNGVYPVLTAILFHFAGLVIPFVCGKIRLEPKGEFMQKYNETPYLEYVCCFTTDIMVDIDDIDEGDIVGALVEYYLKPEEIGGKEPVYSEVVNAQ